MSEPTQSKKTELVPVKHAPKPTKADQLPRLGMVLEEIAPQGEKTKIREWLNRDIVILAAEPFTGVYGVALYVTFADENGVLYNTIIGQALLAKKIYSVRDNLPLKARVFEVEGGAFGRYFDIE